MRRPYDRRKLGKLVWPASLAAEVVFHFLGSVVAGGMVVGGLRRVEIELDGNTLRFVLR